MRDVDDENDARLQPVDRKPEQLIEYVDSFKSEWVGAYFDCSNMLRYGVPSQDWIRALGAKRLVKFDFKAFSMAKAILPLTANKMRR